MAAVQRRPFCLVNADCAFRARRVLFAHESELPETGDCNAMKGEEEREELYKRERQGRTHGGTDDDDAKGPLFDGVVRLCAPIG